MLRGGILIVALGAAVVAACVVKSGSSAPPPGGGGGVPGNGGGGAAGASTADEPGIETVVDDSGREYRISQGVRGEPSVVGCADGQREAFVDAAAFPAIAGCMGSWQGSASLRAAPTGASCGDDGAACAVPADVCAPGWHVCGATGAVAELRAVTAEQCEQAGGGRFSAAVSHCTAQSDCKYDMSATASYPCFESGWCSEPVCCGNDCGEFGVCKDGIWPEATHIPVGMDQGCAAVHADRAGGVLCCR